MSTASNPPNRGRIAADADVTSQLWGRQAPTMSERRAWKLAYWQSHPVTQRQINRLMTGNETESG
jgi:hypothetical protein